MLALPLKCTGLLSPFLVIIANSDSETLMEVCFIINNNNNQINKFYSGYVIKYMDEFVDDCLTNTTYLDVDLPPLSKRMNLEATKALPPRKSLLNIVKTKDEP